MDVWNRPILTDATHSAYACNNPACERHPASLYGAVAVESSTPSPQPHRCGAVEPCERTRCAYAVPAAWPW